MSRQKPGQAECGARWFALARFIRRQCARAGERHKETPSRLHSFVLRIGFATLCAIALVAWGAEISRAEMPDPERAVYADALAYCRGDVARPMALRSDKRVLCLDGPIHAPHEYLIAHGLEEGGLFVVRGHGGGIGATVALADMLLLRQATVIVNDYCLAACANYLFIASLKTFVPKDNLVAWTNQGTEGCIGFSEMRDPTAPYFREVPCAGSGKGRAGEFNQLKEKFYKGRVLAPPFDEPPESIAVRRILKRKFDATGEYPLDVHWTWNPRHYASAIRTKIVYEDYPQSQDRVDAILARIGLRVSVIYDP
jgi:hypothetical protein